MSTTSTDPKTASLEERIRVLEEKTVRAIRLTTALSAILGITSIGLAYWITREAARNASGGVGGADVGKDIEAFRRLLREERQWVAQVVKGAEEDRDQVGRIHAEAKALHNSLQSGDVTISGNLTVGGTVRAEGQRLGNVKVRNDLVIFAGREYAGSSPVTHQLTGETADFALPREPGQQNLATFVVVHKNPDHAPSSFADVNGHCTSRLTGSGDILVSTSEVSPTARWALRVLTLYRDSD